MNSSGNTRAGTSFVDGDCHPVRCIRGLPWRIAVRERRPPSANATDDRERAPANGVTLSLRLSSRVSVVCPCSLFSPLFSTESDSGISCRQVTCQPGEISDLIEGKGDNDNDGATTGWTKVRTFENSCSSRSRRLFEPPLVHTRDQSGGLHSEKFGSAVRALDPPVGFFEDHQKVVALLASKLGLDRKST